MSLLKSLKGTFKGVQEDISEGLKSLTTSPDKITVPELRHLHSSVVNYDAGGDLLNKHELIWTDLYQTTEETAKKAQDVDVDIGKLFVYYDKQSEILTKLHTEAANLPMLLTHLQEITDSLAHVEEEYDKVEAALVHLENICEEQEFHKNTISHHKQLAVYKMKKEHELQKFKVQLAHDHAHKMEQMNNRRQNLQHERQSAYEDQFTQDVDYFKKHGKPGRSPSTPESEKKLDLADIEIEDDPSALDAFLDSSATDLTASDTKDNPESEVPSDSDGPSVEIIAEITSPSEVEECEVTSPCEVEADQISSPSENEKDINVQLDDEKTNTEEKTSEQTGSQSVPEEEDITSPEDALHTDSSLPSDKDSKGESTVVKPDE